MCLWNKGLWKQYCLLIRHRDWTSVYSFLISLLLNGRFISIHSFHSFLLYLCISLYREEKKKIKKEQKKKGTVFDSVQICEKYGTHSHFVTQHILNKRKSHTAISIAPTSLSHSSLKQSVWEQLSYMQDSYVSRRSEIIYVQVIFSVV